MMGDSAVGEWGVKPRQYWGQAGTYCSPIPRQWVRYMFKFPRQRNWYIANFPRQEK